MTNNDQQKQQWKKEAEQLKADLRTRPKIVKKNEVPIRFGTQSQPSNRTSGSTQLKNTSSSPHQGMASQSTPESDDILRKRLGLL